MQETFAPNIICRIPLNPYMLSPLSISKLPEATSYLATFTFIWEDPKGNNY